MCDVVFEVFQGRDGKLQTPHQTSWGVSTRLIGAIIMVHGDDNGLVLPPYVAPTQLVVIPIASHKPGVIPAARKLLETIQASGIRANIDESDKTPGFKFAEAEMKGIPLRLEIGPRDIENGTCVLVKRHNGEKIVIKQDELVEQLPIILSTIHHEMYEKAHKFVLDHIKEAHTFEELTNIVNEGNYAKMMWCGDEECENKIKEATNATSRCMPFNQNGFADTCPICGKKANKVVLFAKAY